jgi:cell division protein FtsQ
MWDRPDLLNRFANVLFGIAGFLGLYAAALVVVNLPVFPLREVRITTPVTHVTAAQVEAVVRRELRGNFFTLRLPTARSAFEKLPWVRGVTVRRQWPDRLEVALEEHVPLARWGNQALVNVQGELFAAAYDGELPFFIGPPGSVKEIAIQFAFFSRSLEGLALKPTRMQLSARRAWQVGLSNGTVLELGREQVEARLARYVGAQRHVAEQLQRRVSHVDLRYANGFAVRIPELKERSAAPQRRG